MLKLFASARKLLRRRPAPPAAGALSTNPDERAGSSIRLSWVWTTATHPDANLGDALSAVIVSAMSGLKVERASFGQPVERLAAVGTIGHAQHGGKIHLWGTGFDLKRNWKGALSAYEIPANTELVVHGVRGRRTATALRKLGLQVPDVFGDPVWFLPRVFPFEHREKDCELGVIVHISELDTATAVASVRANLARYDIPPSLTSSIRIINTYTPPTLEGLRDKVREIASCRRILSTSLHGLVIAETYGIPCAWFANQKGSSGFISIEGDRPIDHRMIDFYSGVDRDCVLSYVQPMQSTTDWDQAMRFLDAHWSPLAYTGERLFDAFPLDRVVKFERQRWKARPGLLEANPY
ncbi:polysaccharide pyruvyl transferase family protein [Rhizobium sp. BK376]|uniref:polysaccharide pyruvyl transferase family protein n=1 Tax=Rhizobium sp. BK376 TaxID=2512149 RepID=UPI0014042E3E|nr:polysaccharide pyruvyl transferase family protein [Rhizobium sp. BK376]